MSARIGDQITYSSTVRQVSVCHCRHMGEHSKYRVNVPSIGRGSGIDYVWLCGLNVNVIGEVPRVAGSTE